MSEWYPLGARQSGPADKQGYAGTGQRSSKIGAICHSMVGSYTSAKRELMNPARRASWTFSVLQDGRVMQHYPIRSITWHGGSREANMKFAGIENEGGFSPHNEPLTSIQTKSLTDLLAWLGDEFGWAEWTRQVTLWEHNEMTRFGSAPTACPSGRIPWASMITELEKEDDVDQEARDMIAELKEETRLTKKAIAALEVKDAKLDAVNSFQNEILVGNKAAIDFLSKIAVNHEARIKKLEA